VHQAGGARPVPAAVRLSRAPRWPHGPPGRDGRWPRGSAIRNLPRKIGPLRNIWATPVAQSFRGSRMFRANGGGGAGAQHGTASAPLHAPARPHAPADRARPPARACGPHPPGRPHAPADRARPAARARRTGSGSPVGLPACGTTRSTGHDLAGRTAIDPGPSVSVAAPRRIPDIY
jgi:hypothetical protein